MQKKYDPFRLLRDFLCGLIIGGGAILPGVSGGVLAVVFGVYRPFMELLTSPWKALPRYWRMLIPLGIGAGVGFLAFAKGLSVLFALSDAVAVWLFLGLIAGTLPQLFREAGKEGRTGGSWVSLLACFAVMFAMLYYVSRGVSVQVMPGFGGYVFSGVLFGMGVIVPGMTSSAVLMALGLYESVLAAMTELNIPVLMAVALGVVLSVLLLARLVNWVFRRYYSMALHGILGVVIASTLVIVPTAYSGIWEMVISAACCVGGYALARLMERLDARIEKKD